MESCPLSRWLVRQSRPRTRSWPWCGPRTELARHGNARTIRRTTPDGEALAAIRPHRAFINVYIGIVVGGVTGVKIHLARDPGGGPARMGGVVQVARVRAR